jgi:hypothetical protein
MSQPNDPAKHPKAPFAHKKTISILSKRAMLAF